MNFGEILQIAEILSILGGGSLVAFRLGRTSTRVEAAMSMQGREIATLKDEIKVLGQIVTQVAVQTARLDMMEKRYEELRHGEGFVFPLATRLASVVGPGQ